MRCNRSAGLIRIFSILIVSVFSSSFLFAEGKRTFSLQVVIKAFSIGDIQNKDFTGETYLESDDELFLVPKIKGNYALGGALGGRIDLGGSFLQGASFEVGYCSSDHTYSFMDAESQSMKATVSNFFINMRTYFLKKRMVQPLIYLGFGSSRLVAKNGSYSYTLPPRVGDITYTGSDFGFGAGFAVYLPANFLFCAEAGYHFFIMKNVKGVLEEKYEIEATSATYLRLSIGLGYSFKLGKT